MVITLLATHYENQKMVAARRWRSLVCFLVKEGTQVFVVTPGVENNEYIGDSGEIIIVFKIPKRKKANNSDVSKIKTRKTIPSPFPYLDVSLITWLASIRDKRIHDCCSQSNILISTYGPSGAMLLGLWFSYKYKKPWVLDLRDSFQVPNSFGFNMLTKLNMFIEKRIVRKADLCITVGKTLAKFMRGKYQCDIKVIYNGWLDSDRLKLLGSQQEKSFYIYAGSLYQHQLASLKVFLLGLLAQKKHTLRIRLVKDYSGYLDEWLVENGFNDIVEIMPAILNKELQLEIESSLAVLVLEELTPNEWQKGTVTGKLFSLLVSGIPGIVICHPSVELYTLAQQANGWFCAHDKASAVKAIEYISVCNRDELNSNKDVFKGYQFSVQAKKLTQLFKGVINERN
ncbi:MAG: glycosyltransferase [Colwellia sp.]